MSKPVKFYYKGKPVRRLLNGNDYVLFQYKIKAGMSCDAAVEAVMKERREQEADRKMRLSLIKANAASHHRNDYESRVVRFFRTEIEKLEKAFKRKTGNPFPPDVPRPATSPKCLDDIYLITRYGRIKMALEALKHG